MARDYVITWPAGCTLGRTRGACVLATGCSRADTRKTERTMSLRRTRIRIVGDDPARATRDAASLRDHLLEAVPEGLGATLEKDDRSTQDMGATLAIVLGGPALVAVAQGIADWLRRRRLDSALEIEIDGRRIKASGEIAEDPKKLESLILALRGSTPGQ